MPKISRVFNLRHIERQKKHATDPQTPTKPGFLAALQMGYELGEKYDPHFVDITSSPQPRAKRTAELMMRGLLPLDQDTLTVTIKTDERLNEFSTDKRDLVVAAVKTARAMAQQFGLEPEQAMMVGETTQPVAVMKANEMIEVIDELGAIEGDHLMTVHGCSQDGACSLLQKRLDDKVVYGMGANGGQFFKCEGFVATYEDGVLKSIEIIRLPPHIRATFAMLAE